MTIAKAGIHASLNARCSVIAAANPLYGQYDKKRRPQENIGLPDSLLSRFDLLFIVLDQLDPTLDRRLSEHVLKSHQYRRAGNLMEPEPLNQGSTLNLDDTVANDVAVDTPVWLRGGRAVLEPSRAGSPYNGDLLTKEFLRKYIHYAKNRIHPTLSEDAMETIAAEYAGMRGRQQGRRNLPITARTLETMIRLASASAKARLSLSVENRDVEVAVDLLNFVIFHEVGNDPIADVTAGDRPMEESVGMEEQKGGGGEEEEVQHGDSAGEVNREDPRYDTLLDVLQSEFVAGTESIELDTLLARLNGPSSSSSSSAGSRRPRFSREQTKTMLEALQQENKVSLCLSNRIMSS